MFKLQKKSVGQKVAGIFASPIPYEVRVPSGDWTPFFGHYQQQRWGQWDSDSCWCLSAINCIEDQLEWLSKNGMFSKEAMNFFTSNGYIDSDGDFSLSERFLEILSGIKDNGNSQWVAWQLAQKYGLIPRSQLTYSVQQAQQFNNKASFNTDYFNPSLVTPAMLTLGKQFLTYVNIASQWIGNNNQTPNLQIMQAALKQAPLQLGIPVPQDGSWNQTLIAYNGRTQADHAIECYAIDTLGYHIFDQYQPNLKILSANYFIPMCTQGIVTAIAPVIVNPIPQPQGQMNDTFWTWVLGWFSGFRNSPVPIGHV